MLRQASTVNHGVGNMTVVGEEKSQKATDISATNTLGDKLDKVMDDAADGRTLQQRLQCSCPKVSLRLAAKEEEKKVHQILRGILHKLQAFCEKTLNVYKELKDGVPTVVEALKKVKMTRRCRLAAQDPKACVSVAVCPKSKDTGTDAPCWWPAFGPTQPELKPQRPRPQKPSLQKPKLRLDKTLKQREQPQQKQQQQELQQQKFPKLTQKQQKPQQ